MTGKAWYQQQLANPLWKEKRLEILERDGYKCKMCGGTEKLQVHHTYYQGLPWEVPNRTLFTLCNSCHFKVEKGMEFRLPPQNEDELLEDIIHEIEILMNTVHSKLKKYGGIVEVKYLGGKYTIKISSDDTEAYLKKINNKTAIAVETK